MNLEELYEVLEAQSSIKKANAESLQIRIEELNKLHDVEKNPFKRAEIWNRIIELQVQRNALLPRISFYENELKRISLSQKKMEIVIRSKKPIAKQRKRNNIKRK